MAITNPNDSTPVVIENVIGYSNVTRIEICFSSTGMDSFTVSGLFLVACNLPGEVNLETNCVKAI